MPKKYQVEIKKYDPDGEEEASFDTLSEAYEWICSMRAYGFWSMMAWVNGERFKVKDGIMFNIEPEADEAAEMEKYFEAMNAKPFIPQPTRGMAPQNPATLAAIGKEGV